MSAPSSLRTTTGRMGFVSSLVGIASEKLSSLIALLFSLFFLFTSIYISTRRLLWFDEFNAIRTANLPDLATVWRVQNSWLGDSAPITYGLLARVVYRLSGGLDISIRFLSATAMAGAMLVVFDCGRRLKDGTC